MRTVKANKHLTDVWRNARERVGIITCKKSEKGPLETKPQEKPQVNVLFALWVLSKIMKVKSCLVLI